MKRLEYIEEKSGKQLKIIEDQGKIRFDAIEKNNQLKDDETKISTLKRWTERINWIISKPNWIISTLMWKIN